MKTLLFTLFAFLSIIEGTVVSPSGSTVWTNGETVQIQWESLPTPELTIVLTRTGTLYHHTITSYTPNSGSGTFTWQVEIPPQDGWPSSTASDLVYEIDFYINGGWNNNGQLVARSQQFAIVWSGSGSPSTTVTIIDPTTSNAAGWATTVQTEVIVGVTTFTTVVTTVYPIGTPGGSTATVVVQSTPAGIVTITITNTQQLQSITQATVTGATTIGHTATTQGPQFQLNNAESRKPVVPVMIYIVGVLLGILNFG